MNSSWQKIFDPSNDSLLSDSRAYDDGEIPVKYKEMMGLVASWHCDAMIVSLTILFSATNPEVRGVK